MVAEPDDGGLHHALGLLLAREGRHSESVDHLGRAAALDPGEARYAYVFAVALHSAGEPGGALRILGEAHRRHPSDEDILIALALYSRDQGALDAALGYARKLVESAPGNAEFRRLLAQLEAAPR